MTAKVPRTRATHVVAGYFDGRLNSVTRYASCDEAVEAAESTQRWVARSHDRWSYEVLPDTTAAPSGKWAEYAALWSV